jgi:hypothetical protein
MKLYSSVVIILTVCVNITKQCILLHTVFLVCFVLFSRQRAIISLNRTYGLAFITETWRASCEFGFDRVVVNFYWSSPAQSFLVSGPVGLIVLFLCLTTFVFELLLPSSVPCEVRTESLNIIWKKLLSNWKNPCGGGVNTSNVTLRVVGGDEKGSLKSETVKYGLETKRPRT